MEEDLSDLLNRKKQLRAEVMAACKQLPHKLPRSQRIWQWLAQIPEFQTAHTLLVYVSTPDEVHTQAFFPPLWREGKRLVVPFCRRDHLELFRLDRWTDLRPGVLGILEPKPEVRSDPDRHVLPEELDFVITPGLAFDPRGGRVGHGRGYFDKLFPLVRPTTPRVAVAFQCQIYPEVPMLPHDVFMDKVVTEDQVYITKRVE